MPLDTLENVLAHELSDLLSAENQIAKALGQVAKAADSDQVRQMAEQHREETQQQIDNLKQAFSVLGQKPEKMVCKGAQGIVEENNTTLKEEKPKGALKDVALLAGSLRIEHYEVAGYTSAIATAKALGRREVVQLLQANLKQEKDTAKKVEAAASEILKSAGSGAQTASATAASGKTAAKTASKPANAKQASSSRSGKSTARRGTSSGTIAQELAATESTP
jgi:ferritin-like metal-binding protein YciE